MKQDVQSHISCNHDEVGCLICQTYKKEEVVLRKRVEEKDNIIAMLREQNSNLTKKNVQSEKDIRRSEVALAECIFEKSEVTKEISVQREALDAVIKQNTILNEDLKVKDEIIKAIT